jgi:hypothetical protein
MVCAHCFRQHLGLGGDDVEVLTKAEPRQETNNRVAAAKIRTDVQRHANIKKEGKTNNNAHVKYGLGIIYDV